MWQGICSQRKKGKIWTIYSASKILWAHMFNTERCQQQVTLCPFEISGHCDMCDVKKRVVHLLYSYSKSSSYAVMCHTNRNGETHIVDDRSLVSCSRYKVWSCPTTCQLRFLTKHTSWIFMKRSGCVAHLPWAWIWVTLAQAAWPAEFVFLERFPTMILHSFGGLCT